MRGNEEEDRKRKDKSLVCAWHCEKENIHLPKFYSGRKWVLEKLNNLPHVRQLVKLQKFKPFNFVTKIFQNKKQHEFRFILCFSFDLINYSHQ